MIKIFMNKKMLIVGAVMIGAGIVTGGGYYWWTVSRKTSSASLAPASAGQALADIQNTMVSVNSGMIDQLFAADADAPDGEESLPDANPYRNANPFSDLKVNPFE
jgi:L-asparagine transporter-like permease